MDTEPGSGRRVLAVPTSDTAPLRAHPAGHCPTGPRPRRITRNRCRHRALRASPIEDRSGGTGRTRSTAGRPDEDHIPIRYATHTNRSAARSLDSVPCRPAGSALCSRRHYRVRAGRTNLLCRQTCSLHQTDIRPGSCPRASLPWFRSRGWPTSEQE